MNSWYDNIGNTCLDWFIYKQCVLQDETKNGVIKPKKGKDNCSAIRTIDFDSNSNASTIISDTTDENIQVQGPTTRRQWSELVSKPKSDSASMVASSNEEEDSVISEATTGSLSQVCCPRLEVLVYLLVVCFVFSMLVALLKISSTNILVFFCKISLGLIIHNLSKPLYTLLGES